MVKKNLGRQCSLFKIAPKNVSSLAKLFITYFDHYKYLSFCCKYLEISAILVIILDYFNYDAGRFEPSFS